MATEAPRPPNVEVGDLTDNDLRASAALHSQLAASLREIIRLRSSSNESSHELGELKQRLHDAERTSEESQKELNACRERLRSLEDELQQAKCELNNLQSGKTDTEFRLEGAEARLKAAQLLLGEYVLKISQLEASQQPSTRLDASTATSLIRKRARSPSLEIIETPYPSPGPAKCLSTKKFPESPSTGIDSLKRNTEPMQRHTVSPAAYLPTPPPSSNLEEFSTASTKRRKIAVDDETEYFKATRGDFKNNQPLNTAPCINDVANGDVSSNLPRNPPADSVGLKAARIDPHSTTTCAPLKSSPSATVPELNSQAPSSPPTNVPDAPLSSRPTPPVPVETSANLSPRKSPIQVATTTVDAAPCSTSSASTTSVNCSVPPQTDQTNPGAVKTPNVSMVALNKVSLPFTTTANIMRSAIVGTTERPSPPAPTTASAHPTSAPATSSATIPTVGQNVNSQSQLSHNMGIQTSNQPFTAPPASITTQKSSQASTSNVDWVFESSEAWRSLLWPMADPPRTSSEENLSQVQAHDGSIPPALSSMVQKYLPSTKAKIFPISPSPLTTEVPRAFLRAVYGGSDQQFLQIFRKDKRPTGDIERRIVFPQFDLNPAMPSAPGHPGLVYASRHEILENPPWSVFRKGVSSKKAVWLYLGDYESELVGKMTAKEFSDLTTSVKRKWATSLLAVKLFKVYVSMRARIALRKAGCIPLKDKEKEEALIDEEIDAVKLNRGRPVDVDDVVGALERGDEGIDIIRMICIHYDHAFAKDMEQKLVDYKGASARSKSSSSGTTKRAGTSTSAPSAVATPKPLNALQDRPLPRYRDPFEDEFDAGEIEGEDSDFELDTSLPKESSDRELRPRASRVFTIED